MNKKPFLQTKAISKCYGKHEALKGVSLDIHAGEIVSLLGVNGAGKTTLSSVIATLYPPTSGSVLYEGQSIYENLYDYRRIIGYCPQKPNLNPLITLEQNLQFAGRYFSMSEQEIATRIEELSHHLKLSRYLKEKSTVLSGGYKQRFLIARSLMHKPKLVILDEPTVALDPHIRHQLWKYIKTLKEENVTVLLTTHYLDEAEYLSDRVCLLERGELKVVDTPQNLLEKYGKSKLEDVFLTFAHDDL